MSSNPKKHRYSTQSKTGESKVMSTSNHWATPEAIRRYQNWLKSEGLTKKNIGQGKILEENAYQNNPKLNYFFEQVKTERRRYLDGVKTSRGWCMSEPVEKPPVADIKALFTEIPADIAKALIALQQEVRALEKTAKNDHFRNTYAPLDEVMDNALPLLAKNKLGLMQWPVTKGDKHFLHTVLVHENGANLQADIELLLVKRDPQGLGSALTYTRRQTVMAILGLSAKDEDDDGNKASNHLPPPSPEQIERIRAICSDLKYPEEEVQRRLRTVKTENHAIVAINKLEQVIAQRAQAIAAEAAKTIPVETAEPTPVNRDTEAAVKARLQTFGFASNKMISAFIMAHTKKPLLGNCGPEHLKTLNEVLDRVERGEEKLPEDWLAKDVTSDIAPPEETA